MITLNKSLEFKRAMFGCFVKTFTKGHPLIVIPYFSCCCIQQMDENITTTLGTTLLSFYSHCSVFRVLNRVPQGTTATTNDAGVKN